MDAWRDAQDISGYELRECDTLLKEIGLDVKCPYCGRRAKFIDAEEVLGRRGEGMKAYVCRKCRAHVLAYAGTNVPSGTLATRELHALRKKADKSITSLWEDGVMDRSEAITRIAGALGLTGTIRPSTFSEGMCLVATETAAELRGGEDSGET